MLKPMNLTCNGVHSLSPSTKRNVMKVLMFGWEFPPHILGGLGTASYGITKGLSLQPDVHITFCLPFVVVTVYSRLKGFDVRMLEAAKDLGASEVTILRKIILPLAMPAVAAGWLLSFTLSMDDVVVSSFVTGPGYEILPLKIYSMVKVGVSPEVNALATILLVLSLVMVIASQLIARDKTKGR